MLVYGDRSRTVDPRALVASIAENLSGGAESDRWRRQDRLRAALITAGELAQGLADAEFEACGFDDETPIQRAALDLATTVARLFARVLCESRRAAHAPDAEIAALMALTLPQRVSCKTPEGYAFYAVYPESYLTAAERERWDASPAVIGLRSIGTGLAAAVAAATGAALTVTLRPCGHPFRREVRLSPRLRARLAAHAGPWIVADEGPGLSGSSFGAAADLLESLGVGRERIIFMPSHAGDPGPQAQPRHRAGWRAARRLVSTLDDLLVAEPIARWFEDLIGAAHEVEDLSGGAWTHSQPASRRPPTWPAQERRKFRLTTASGVYLARFAGLGATGAEKFAQARALHAHGFTPEPLALRRGFLLERWQAGGPLDLGGEDPRGSLDWLARYLAFRAVRFPARAEEGASFPELRSMAVHNAAALHGEALATAVGKSLDGAQLDASALRPVRVDGRLQAWEWLRRADGALVKTDALDHAVGHDLVGCQDIAWDIAGAASEWRLSGDEIDDLTRTVSGRSGAAVAPAAVAAFRICYAAFQAGYWSMAADGAAPSDRDIVTACRDRHVADLRRLAGAA